MKKLVMTGGGSAGHVIPNVALIPELKEKFDLYYVVTNGIEKNIIAPFKIPYFTIDCTKLIRGFSPRNFTIPFKFIKSVM